ncbi:hypothetical protein LCGC14_1853420 [marine sediment metagenome]|uniref:Uncharacterized protein n=1 Tax=marine sediment metagenome TaxID=412755 RepID=A0A0F9IP82_9ZZZZ
MSKCICKGNWRSIVNETEHLLDRRFRDNKGEEYSFFGIVHGSDDYYYGMWRRKDRELTLLSCVGSIDGHGYVLQEENDEQT